MRDHPLPCGRGGIGRRAALRSLWGKLRGSSSLLDRTKLCDTPADFLFLDRNHICGRVCRVDITELPRTPPGSCRDLTGHRIWFWHVLGPAHEDRQFTEIAEKARQELPHRTEERPGLRDQQDQPALQGAPGLIA